MKDKHGAAPDAAKMGRKLRDADEAIAANPDDHEGYLAKATALHILGQNSDALDPARTAARLAPQSPRAHALLGA